ncbi:MAG: T9SS type A sorting domain-containing protein [Bacteroidales bacterium]|nr:T9SS type A sorting domain-containing protein [Bacteroidales bacterium]
MKSLFLLLASIFLGSTITLGQWQRTTGLNGGYVYDFTATSTHLYLGTIYNGIYVSDDNGDTWSNASNGLTKLQVSSLTHSGDTVFAAMQDVGVFCSIDHGQNWTTRNTGLTELSVLELEFNGGTLWAGTNYGIYKSVNNGLKWYKSSNGIPADIGSDGFAFSGNRIYAATNDGVYYSDNDGNLWQKTGPGNDNPNIWSILSNGPYLYAGTYGSGLYLSTNQGNSWSQMSGLAPAYIFSLTYSGNTLFAGTQEGVFASTDDGITWIKKTNGMPASQEVNAIYANGSYLYAGFKQNGVFRSSDNGNNWIERNEGMSGIPVFSMVTKGNSLFAGTAAGLYVSGNEGLSWESLGNVINFPEIGNLAVFGNRLYAGGVTGLYQSDDDGLSWVNISGDLDHDWIADILPTDTAIYAAIYGGGIYKTRNGGQNWTKISQGIPTPFTLNIAIIGDCLYAGTEYHGVYRSTDDGTSWTQAQSGLPAYCSVSALLSNGTNLISGIYEQGLFVSGTYGTLWHAAVSGFPSFSTPRCLMAVQNNIFAGTSSNGIFASADNGNNWTDITGNFTRSSVNAMTTLNSYIYAGTLGEGIWKRKLSDVMGIDDAVQLPFAIVYPNPATNFIKTKAPKGSRFSIYDLSGKLLASEILKDETESLDISSLSSGLYIAEIQLNDQITREKFLKL